MQIAIQENGVFISPPKNILAILEKLPSPVTVDYELDPQERLQITIPIDSGLIDLEDLDTLKTYESHCKNQPYQFKFSIQYSPQ